MASDAGQSDRAGSSSEAAHIGRALKRAVRVTRDPRVAQARSAARWKPLALYQALSSLCVVQPAPPKRRAAAPRYLLRFSDRGCAGADWQRTGEDIYHALVAFWTLRKEEIPRPRSWPDQSLKTSTASRARQRSLFEGLETPGSDDDGR